MLYVGQPSRAYSASFNLEYANSGALREEMAFSYWAASRAFSDPLSLLLTVSHADFIFLFPEKDYVWFFSVFHCEGNTNTCLNRGICCQSRKTDFQVELVPMLQRLTRSPNPSCLVPPSIKLSPPYFPHLYFVFPWAGFFILLTTFCRSLAWNIQRHMFCLIFLLFRVFFFSFPTWNEEMYFSPLQSCGGCVFFSPISLS